MLRVTERGLGSPSLCSMDGSQLLPYVCCTCPTSLREDGALGGIPCRPDTLAPLLLFEMTHPICRQLGGHPWNPASSAPSP